MNRQRLLAVILLGLTALAVAGFGLRPARAEETAQTSVRLGFVISGAPSTAPRGVPAFWERLRELGWIEGTNLTVERRWAEGQTDRLPGLMAEVTKHRLDVLVTSGTPAAIAAKNATSTVPIVAVGVADPIASGLVVSLARPTGNLTGLSQAWDDGIPGKWLELLKEIVPRLSRVAVIANLENSLSRRVAKQLEAAAPTMHLKVWITGVGNVQALDRTFAQARRQSQAVLVISDSLTFHARREIAALANRHRLPSVFALREFVDVGGLIAYGPDSVTMFRRGAEYVDKILKGAKPVDLPVEQPTHHVLVVNLKTAKALGITIPESILLRADEVIR